MKEREIDLYLKAGRIASEARKLAISMVVEGGSVLEMVERVEAYINERAEIAFPINVSIDSVAAHFTPSSTDDMLTFRRGQVVKIDVGAHVDGYIADTAETVEVGTSEWSDLLKASKEALRAAIDLADTSTLGEIGDAVESTIRAHGFRPVENLTGHSLERYVLHSGLSIPSISGRDRRRIPSGTAVAIEPFVTTGSGRVDGHVPGNIYIFRKRTNTKNPMARKLLEILEKRPKLPFSERECRRYVEDHRKAISILVRQRAIHSYPILSDIPGSRIAQAEHTILVLDGEVIVTTR